jgi:hypothetical protein
MCTPFRVHLHAELPALPPISVPEELPENWEEQLPAAIGKIRTQQEFPRVYKTWLDLHPNIYSERSRFEWLTCLLSYASRDSNGNGIPDWGTIIDNAPTQILFPQDPDMDGDGVINAFDSAPLDVKIGKLFHQKALPPHLRINRRKRREAAEYQEKLFREFNIVAIDHTDIHSPIVLKELYLVLKNGFSKELLKKLNNIRYVYAFAGHDPLAHVASFHAGAQAISVVGVASYGARPLAQQERIDLISTLAHEIGHAFLLKKLTAEELAQIGAKYGGWQQLTSSDLPDSFFSRVLFQPYFFKVADSESFQRNNIVSQYAMTNRHEWFAEAFAGQILYKLGKLHMLGASWREMLNRNPSGGHGYWVNYNNLNDDFRQWLEVKQQ